MAVHSLGVATWSVVCTTIEPTTLVEAFVAHHLAVGASQVFVFLDNPHDAAGFDLAPGGAVQIIPCDEVHWAGRKGGRPTDHRHRQTHNAEVAARNLARTDWIASVDADEMILSRDERSVGDILAAVPHEIGVARLTPAERMFVDRWSEVGLDLGGAFKFARPGLGRRLYGIWLGQVFPFGFQGHELGKSFRRTGRDDLRFRIHRVFQEDEEAPTHLVPKEEAVLLHLFPASYEDWRSKYERRLSDPSVLAGMRPKQRSRYLAYKDVRDLEGEEGVRWLFKTLCVLPRLTSGRLKEEGLAFEAGLPSGSDAKTMLDPLRAPGTFRSMRRDATMPPGPRAYLVGMEPCSGPMICRHFASRGYSYVHEDGRGVERAFEALDFSRYDGFHLVSGMGLHGDVTRLAEREPHAVFILNQQPVDAWLNEAASGRIAQGLAPLSGSELGEWRRIWGRRQADLEALARAGHRVLRWNVETDKPSHFFRELERCWADPPSGGTSSGLRHSPRTAIREVPMSTEGNPEGVPPGTTGSGENTCRTCEGAGRVDGRECLDCGGTGKVVTPLGGGRGPTGYRSSRSRSPVSTRRLRFRAS